jgi:6-phosphogluconolactonase (cycloisomerase 2 family)
MKDAFFTRAGMMAWLLVAGMGLASAAQVVIVNSPGNDSLLSSPVHYQATASSPQCAQGIAAMRIYIADHVSAYTNRSDVLDTFLSLSPGAYETVVQAWDNCGGVGKTHVNITVTAIKLRAVRFIYVADFGNNKVLGFKVDPSTGKPTPTLQGSVTTNSSYRLASDNGGYRLYLTNAAPQPFSRVYAYFINKSNGSLHQVPGSPFPLSETSGPIAVHPSGKFVFVGTLAFQPGDGILVLKVNPDGSLTEVNSSPVLTNSTPGEITVDPSGKHVYVSSQGGNSIDAFNFDISSGTLTPTPGSPYIVSTPGCVGLGLSGITNSFGKFLYTSEDGASMISAFAIAGTTGTLKEIRGSPFADDGGCVGGGVSPVDLTTEPTGKFLYVLNRNPFYISIYAINAGNGSLRHIRDTVQIGTYSYESLRSDPSGKFLYVPVVDTDGIEKLSGFSVNAVSGELTALPGSPFPLGANVIPFDVAVTP